MFLPHRQAGQPALRLAGLPAYAAKTPSKNSLRLGWAAQAWSVENSPFIRSKNLKP